MSPIPYAQLADVLDKAKLQEEAPLIVILDNLEDPHNLGSILRTCDAMGVHGVIIPKRRSATLTDVVAKTSTGAMNYVPVVRVTNLAQTIKKLKDLGFWIFGTAMSGADYRTWDANGATALVIGNEGKGISPGVAKLMDATLSIPMVGHVQSLNASVAAGVLLYQAYNSRHKLEE
ncbi:23S rRNA (guanosine-2'-O-) -methyltransferase RlmB [Agrilactobacillus composti DSM 18527 = JCM 14202]|nr:23S rRNA (guanosine-2'-O-) -methyltransferase RlmB [Agrilactobacillus composti DSM 18527 = JCM 14202]